ncbi:MAG: phospholipase D-like domain-containing protein [Gammaproteobacteria bacterium]
MAAPRAVRSLPPGTQLTRRVFGAAQATQNLIQTLFWDPILRPYSTAAAMGSVALKSGSGMIHRTSVTLDSASTFQASAQLSYADPMDLQAWEQDLDRIVGRRALQGKINYLIDGGEFFPRLSQAIAEAKTKVDMRTYIFDNDDVAVEIADMLRERSKDIRVRVLLDGIGTLLGTQVNAESMPADFEPPLSMTRYLEDGSRVRVRTHSNPVMTGDHVKSTIIDGEMAFIGGMNIGREYRYEWHDMMMEVTGEVVGEIQRDADKAWGKAGLLGDLGQLLQTIKPRRQKRTEGGYPIRVLYTLPHDSQIYRAQLAAIRRAKSYIFIENAYFSDDIIMHALVQARQRGVDVRVIIPSIGNHPMMNLSNLVEVNTMLAHGIRVYRYPGMSHIKAAVFDGWACVGSANFDAMSLRINREMNLATSDPTAVRELLTKLFYKDFAAATEVSEPTKLDWRHNLAELIADAAL